MANNLWFDLDEYERTRSLVKPISSERQANRDAISLIDAAIIRFDNLPPRERLTHWRAGNKLDEARRYLRNPLRG